jgi:tRNA1Val (adenine37-N6)-methyltransferase
MPPSNDYFRFKQFCVRQAGAAMKVGTDGVLLGAWARIDGTEGRILDIGTGTGLIALMAAQRAPLAQIDAVEIDEAAFRQAQANAAASPWSDRICIYHTKVQDFGLTTTHGYNHILANPPFFVNSLKAPDAARSSARHADELPLEALASAAARLLASQGRLSVIYPSEEAERFEALLRPLGLFCRRKTRVRGRADKPVKRILMEFSPLPSGHETEPEEDELTIESAPLTHTAEYIALTRDFYLKF